jgi:hypothetical protein
MCTVTTYHTGTLPIIPNSYAGTGAGLCPTDYGCNVSCYLPPASVTPLVNYFGWPSSNSNLKMVRRVAMYRHLAIVVARNNTKLLTAIHRLQLATSFQSIRHHHAAHVVLQTLDAVPKLQPRRLPHQHHAKPAAVKRCFPVFGRKVKN